MTHESTGFIDSSASTTNLAKNWIHALDPSTFQQRKEEKLVTSGPYRYTRNPIYLGFFVFIIAQSLVAANWLLLLPAFVIVTVLYMQIGGEELMLTNKFGDEFVEYLKRTLRLVPKIRLEPQEYDSDKRK